MHSIILIMHTRLDFGKQTTSLDMMISKGDHMKFEHILEDIKETIVRVITNKENVQDFNDIVESLSKELVFLGRNERDKQVPIS